MEKDFISWSNHQHSARELPNFNSLCAPSELGQENSVFAYLNPYSNTGNANGTSMEFPLSGSPYSMGSQLNEPRGWFYGLPRFRQAFTSMRNKIVEKIPHGHDENRIEAVSPNVGSGFAQKRFLVFDQSGDKTTLIFNPGVGTPFQCLTYSTPKPLGAYVPNKDDPGKLEVKVHHSGPNLTDEYNVNGGDDLCSDMREDSDELNALLYSDDEYEYSEDDEETSTGHSPSTMTANDQQEWSVESGEEVASSTEPNKKRKISDGAYSGASPLMDTVVSAKLAKSAKSYQCSAKSNQWSEGENDAESSCGDVKYEGFDEFDSVVDDKSFRKEKIRETVSILQGIVPGEKGDDAIVVLDEAIRYLKSLKRKAEVLGLHDL